MTSTKQIIETLHCVLVKIIDVKCSHSAHVCHIFCSKSSQQSNFQNFKNDKKEVYEKIHVL